MICTPASLDQEVGLALGAQAGEARLSEVLHAGRLHPHPQGGGDAVQPDPGGAAQGSPRLAVAGDGARPAPRGGRRRRASASPASWIARPVTRPTNTAATATTRAPASVTRSPTADEKVILGQHPVPARHAMGVAAHGPERGGGGRPRQDRKPSSSSGAPRATAANRALTAMVAQAGARGRQARTAPKAGAPCGRRLGGSSRAWCSGQECSGRGNSRSGLLQHPSRLAASPRDGLLL